MRNQGYEDSAQKMDFKAQVRIENSVLYIYAGNVEILGKGREIKRLVVEPEEEVPHIKAYCLKCRTQLKIDDLYLTCPTCGWEYKFAPERNKVIPKLKLMLDQSSNTYVLDIPSIIIEKRKIHLLSLENYSSIIPLKITIRINGKIVPTFQEPSLYAMERRKDLEAFYRKKILRNLRKNAVALIIIRTGTQSNRKLYIERLKELFHALKIQQELSHDLLILSPRENPFGKPSSEIEDMLKYYEMAYDSVDVKIDEEQILRAIYELGYPEFFIDLFKALPRVLLLLKEGHPLAEAIKKELGPENKSLHFIAEAAERALNKKDKLVPREVRDIVGSSKSGAGSFKMGVLKSLNLVY